MLNFLKIRSLGARIIAINIIGLIFLAIGFILVDKSENNLIEARKEALILQANLIAFSFTLSSDVANQETSNMDNLFITENWTATRIARTQIFNDDLVKIFDSKDFKKELDRVNEDSKFFFSNFIKIIKEFFRYLYTSLLLLFLKIMKQYLMSQSQFGIKNQKKIKMIFDTRENYQKKKLIRFKK